MTAPSPGTVVTASQPFSVSLTLTNNGPDFIKPSDSLLITFFIDGSSTPETILFNGQQRTYIGGNFSTQVPVGGTGNVTQALNLVNAPAPGTHELCAVAYVMNRSTDSVHETQPANNRSCASLLFQSQSTAIPITAGLLSQPVIYPNPATGQVSIFLEMNRSEPVSVTLTDLSGRVVYQRNEGLKSGSTLISINTGQLPSGTYLYALTIGSDPVRGKIVVSH